MTDKLKT